MCIRDSSPSTTCVGLANASTPLVWLGISAYGLQLYFDFSGYSLMGIGMGKMLGFDFPANFNYPYKMCIRDSVLPITINITPAVCSA